MSVIDEVLEANRIYAQNFTLGQLVLPPARSAPAGRRVVSLIWRRSPPHRREA